ncbi:hypothetical protein V1509DRAFT_564510 [Lipomyces kononenkoae]
MAPSYFKLSTVFDSLRPGKRQTRTPEHVQTLNEQRSDTHSNGQLLKPSGQLSSWLHHFNGHDLRVLFRCWVAAWVAALLMFIGPSFKSIGAATFFACVVVIMLPPSTIVLLFILAGVSLLLGMALAWTWGVIVMKAAVAARPPLETQEKLRALGQQAASQSMATGQSVASVQQELIYSGFMLDTRETVIYFVLISVFIYFTARLRALNPKFVLLQIFAIIVSDVFLTIGPLFYSFRGTLPKILVEPATIGVALGFASSIVLFPESTSYTVLRLMEDLSVILGNLMDFSVLSISNENLDLKDLQQVRAKVITCYKEVESSLAFLPLDFSLGQWDADDVKSLKEPLRRTLQAGLAMLQFHISQIQTSDRVGKWQETHGRQGKDEAHEKESRDDGMRQLTDRQDGVQVLQALQIPEDGTLPSAIVEALKPSSMDIFSAIQDALSVTGRCIHYVKSRQWLCRRDEEQFNRLLDRSQLVLSNLTANRDSFARDTTERLLDNYGDIFDESGRLKSLELLAVHPLRGIMLGIVFEDRVLAVADTVQNLLAQIINLLQRRTRHRLCFPRGLRYAMGWILKTSDASTIQEGSPVADPDVVYKLSKEIQRQLHASQGYRVRQHSRLAKTVLWTYHWLTSAEGLYALRMVVITIALGIPAVIKSSAGFYYREKCIWGLIMGQTTLLVYMADVIFSTITAIIGSIVGGVLGLIAWYIGSGDGPGNAYGLGASMAFVLVLIMWTRVFCPQAILRAVIISGTTCLLVIGYSLDDTHHNTYSDPGIGYGVFWRRLVLVMVGVVAAIIVQLLPTPPTTSRHVCKSLSAIVCSLSDRYALLLSYWGRIGATSSRNEIQLIAEQISTNVAEELSSLSGPISLLRLELSNSPFDSASLQKVKSLCQDINQNMGLLISFASCLPPELQSLLAQRTGMLDEQNISNIMTVLSIAEQSLKTGDALPQSLPTSLIIRCYEHWRNSLNANGDTHMRTEAIELSKDLIRDINYRKFCVAVSSYLNFLAAVDELVIVLKEVVGEAHIISHPATAFMGNQV